ncbi:histidine phosphatase family protein [Salsipaludibacter albus]|uniref:histidine phosphatase family protein n=1 Tax=Salsipaludibacter albus TaxID=2849650 RepID=UPI001EE4261A|nr:histidine phosphatase family protein [Salsipaludibacter albus]MBY5162270.1 histidine phosphatase family protein [Salsipaludibacter albus]
MAITIELRRHTDNDGDALTDDGVAAALALGRSHVGEDWTLVVSTGAQRATQTAANVLAAAGSSVADGVLVEPGLRSADEERWRAAYRRAGSGELDALRTADPAFVDAEVVTLGAALGRVADRLPEGGRALVIGHSPTNEAAVLGLTGTTLAPLSTGAGAILVRADGDWAVTPVDAA